MTNLYLLSRIFNVNLAFLPSFLPVAHSGYKEKGGLDCFFSNDYFTPQLTHVFIFYILAQLTFLQNVTELRFRKNLIQGKKIYHMIPCKTSVQLN